MAQANVEVKVQSQDLDKLKGQLVELQRGLKIQYDIDGKPIDLVIDKTINLQKQLVLLNKERKRVTEGSAEFKLLSEKIGDTEDALARSNAKSRDFLASLQLIPGPIGQFASQLNGVIGLMKTFSGFSLKDLRFQFKQTLDDIDDILVNLGLLSEKKPLEGLSKGSEEASNNVEKLGNKLSTASSQASTTAGALVTTNDAINNVTKSVVASTQEYDNYQNALKNLEKNGIQFVTNALGDKEEVMIQAGNSTKVLSKQELQLAATNQTLKVSTNAATGAIEGLVVAEQVATFWTTTLGRTIQSVLIATGIGALVVLVGEIVSLLYQWATSTEEADKANAALNRTLERQKQLVDDLQAGINAQVLIDIERAKQAGKSEEDIYEIRRKGLQDQLDATRKSANDIAKIEAQLRAEIGDEVEKGEEERVQLLNDYNKQKQDLFNKEIDLTRQITLEDEKEKTRIAEKGRNDRKKNNEQRLQDNKEYLTKLIQDTETGLKKLRQLEEENFLSLIEDEREREGVRLSYEKKKEEEEIKALHLKDTKINGVLVTGEELRQKLLEQIRVKYGIITINNKKKYDQEDLKRSEEFNDKLRDLLISTYEDEVERDIANREEKYNRDLREFERDKEFIKKSETEKNEIRKNLRKAADIDIEKIKFDAMIKGFNDELGLLEAQQRTLTEGTQAYLDNSIAIENQAYAIKIANAKGNAKQIEAINIEHEQNLKNIKLAAFIAQREIDIQRAQSVMTIGTTLQQLAGKNKALATYGVVLEKASAISQIVSNTQIANAKAVAASTLTGGQPWVTINNVSAALGIAATIAAAAKSISEIQGQGNSSSQPTSTGSIRGMARGGYIDGPRHAQGGTIIEAEGGEAVMTRGAVSMFRPILSMMNEAGGGTSFNKNLMVTANDAPITTKPVEQMAPTILKTYVVSNELTTEQEKLARLKNLSTL